MLVHFPIAFYFLELLLTAAWVFKNDESYKRFAEIAFSVGYFFMLVSLASGYITAGGWPHIQGIARKHFLAAGSVFIFYSARFLYKRFADSKSGVFQKVQIAGAVIGNILVAYTAYLGGLLVYS